MSIETHAVIKNSNIVEVKKLIMMAYGGKEIHFASGAKEDATITLPEAFHEGEERFLRISENIYKREFVADGIYSEVGDSYITMGESGSGPKILKFIVSYFGGYYSATDRNGGPQYVELEKDNKKCIKSYFESIEGNT